ncbi:MAG: hypothetical protein LQ352_003321 [Teloschistes flavicans]|nr:MAG: hypothetical protein LQ352_003321 [Teloschistes flavicans]
MSFLGEIAVNMSSYLNDVALNVTKIPDAISIDAENPLTWSWKLVPGLILGALSFGSVESWKAIYVDKPIAIKAGFYDAFSAGFTRKDIGSERDPQKHNEMKRMLSPAFSQRSLLEQESIIGGVIDQFVRVIGEKAPPSSKGINMTKWYEMTSFDILGEMAFGESFHSLDTAQTHSRQDFVSLLAKKVQDGEVEKEEMTAHVSTFVIAGGETVSTFLAGVTYFLLKHPQKLKTLVTEIREAFKSYADINAKDAQQLTYLQAVINEGLRLFPPASQGSPRISSGFELHGRYIPQGAEINVSPWTVAHNPDYWDKPMEFRPERWLDPQSSDVKEASQPFLLGPRSCIGRNFAYMEMNLLLAKMLWTHDLELVNNNLDWLKEGKVHVLWWKPQLFVRFHKRPSIA